MTVIGSTSSSLHPATAPDPADRPGLYAGDDVDPFALPDAPPAAAPVEADPVEADPVRPPRKRGPLFAGHRRLSVPQDLANRRGPDAPADAQPLTGHAVVVYCYLLDRTSSHTAEPAHTINPAADPARCGVSARTFARSVDALVTHRLVVPAGAKASGTPRRVLVPAAPAARRFDVPVAVLWPVKGAGPRWGSRTGLALRALLALHLRIDFATHRTQDGCGAASIAEAAGWSDTRYREALGVLRDGDPVWLDVERTWDPATGWQTENVYTLRYDLLPPQTVPASPPSLAPGSVHSPDRLVPAFDHSRSRENGQNRATENGQNRAPFLTDPSWSDPSLPAEAQNAVAAGAGKVNSREGGTRPGTRNNTEPATGQVPRSKSKSAKTTEPRSPLLMLVTDGSREDARYELQRAVDAANGTRGLDAAAWVALVVAGLVHGPHTVRYDDAKIDRLSPVLLACRARGWDALALTDELAEGTDRLGVGAIYRRAQAAAASRVPKSDPAGPVAVLAAAGSAPRPGSGRAVDRVYTAADYQQPL